MTESKFAFVVNSLPITRVMELFDNLADYKFVIKAPVNEKLMRLRNSSIKVCSLENFLDAEIQNSQINQSKWRLFIGNYKRPFGGALIT